MSDSWPIPCAIAIPQAFTEGEVDLDLVRRFALRAEELGYHSLWVAEQIFGQTPTPEPVAFLSYLAALTNRIRLGSAVIIATTRNPALMAKQLGTLDVLSEGRLIVGTALGGRPNTYPLLGASQDRRARRFAESIGVMKALWTQEEASFKGEFWSFEGLSMTPRPVQKPHPPLWFGGRHPAGLRRTARLADGWMGAGSTTAVQFIEHVQILKDALQDRGRDPEKFPISKRVYVAIDDDADRAERRLCEWFGAWYGNAEMGSRMSVWGSVQQVVDGLMEIAEGGADMLMLNPVFDYMEQLDQLADEVIPRLG
ncbi:MAG: LLM class flavin-dependent oxidoreductase [Chloroflexi bacterium]|nr:LLM class flavin-dependent oxidoreductase [Chloroflexota bacterium]